MLQKIDEAALGRYLEASITGFSGPLRLSKFPGGQSNPTYRIDASSGAYVLRRKPPGKLLKSAHAVDREFRVLKALGNTAVPVAPVYHLCEDEAIIGSAFYVMGFVEGPVYWDPTVPELDNDGRHEVYDEMCKTLAAIHSVDIAAAGLGDFGKPGNYYARQVFRWKEQYRASETSKIEAMDRLTDWVEENIPKDDGRVCLVHGDYRINNLIFAPDAPKVIAVMDWELSTLGHPFADLAYHCLKWRLPAGGRISGLLDIDCQALNIPGEQEYIETYCRLMGIDGIENWTFYLAFCFFRLTAILQGVKKRAVEGNASSESAHQAGDFARSLAETAIRIID